MTASCAAEKRFNHEEHHNPATHKIRFSTHFMSEPAARRKDGSLLYCGKEMKLQRRCIKGSQNFATHKRLVYLTVEKATEIKDMRT